MGEWTAGRIAARVEELRSAHEGPDFVAAVERFGREELDAGERRLLGEVLVRRAREEGANVALSERLEERGWFRRTLRRAEERGAEAARRPPR